MDSARSGDEAIIIIIEAIIIDAPLILIVREVIFYADITHNLQLRGVFRGGQAFFNPQIVLSAAKGINDFVIKYSFKNVRILTVLLQSASK
jgi:hypothetical protein